MARRAVTVHAKALHAWQFIRKLLLLMFRCLMRLGGCMFVESLIQGLELNRPQAFACERRLLQSIAIASRILLGFARMSFLLQLRRVVLV